MTTPYFELLYYFTSIFEGQEKIKSISSFVEREGEQKKMLHGLLKKCEYRLIPLKFPLPDLLYDNLEKFESAHVSSVSLHEHFNYILTKAYQGTYTRRATTVREGDSAWR